MNNSNNLTPVIFSALELEVHFGEQIVLNKASLSIHENDRIGLIGKNGSGKSTFLKIIAGIIQPDRGNIAEIKGLVKGFLSQDFSLDESKNVYENILSGAQRELDLIKEYEQMPFDSPLKHILEEKILRMDSWNIETRIIQLIKALNAPDGYSNLSSLSGGEKRRVALCKALISKPDLLILDEPTNHLDTNSIEWLENFLTGFKGTCIFVTHDRYFLDRIANKIVELSSGTFYYHAGNYPDYLVNKAERQEIHEIEEKKRQQFLKRELEWIRRGPRARRTKAKSRINHFNELSLKRNLEVELDVELIIPPAERLGKKIIEFKNVGMKFGTKILFDKFNFIFEPGRKLGIVGHNGVGKTTFLKMILGEVMPTSGLIDIGETVQFNYVDQERLLLNDEDTVIKAIGQGSEIVKFGKQQLSIWTYLRRFLFNDERLNTLVGKLSGGEKSRLTLAKILCQGGNFLMLDEPTNDLDLSTLRILEEALIAFEGCLIIVSHDRYFLNRVCNGILSFEGDGILYFSEGDYDYYVEKKEQRKIDVEEQKKKPRKDTSYIKIKAKKLSYKDSLELEKIEEKIISAEAEVERIEKIFSSPDFYEKYSLQTKDLKLQLEETKEIVKKLYERWEELEKMKNELS